MTLFTLFILSIGIVIGFLCGRSEKCGEQYQAGHRAGWNAAQDAAPRWDWRGEFSDAELERHDHRADL